MGRSLTNTYRVEFREVGSMGITPLSWRCNESGRPSNETLAAYVDSLEKSSLPGGVNYHPTVGEIVVRHAWITHQATGDVVATYNQPMFKVI